MKGRGGHLALLGMGLVLFFGCAYQTPLYESEDFVLLDVHPSEMILQGTTMASSRRFHILFFRFGSWNSFLEVERQAIEASGSEVLVNRLRLKQFEGFLIPGLWFQALGIQGATDVPILGWEVYTVAGTGVRFVDGRQAPGSEDRPQAQAEDPDVSPIGSQ